MNKKNVTLSLLTIVYFSLSGQLMPAAVPLGLPWPAPIKSITTLYNNNICNTLEGAEYTYRTKFNENLITPKSINPVNGEITLHDGTIIAGGRRTTMTVEYTNEIERYSPCDTLEAFKSMIETHTSPVFFSDCSCIVTLNFDNGVSRSYPVSKIPTLQEKHFFYDDSSKTLGKIKSYTITYS